MLLSILQMMSLTFSLLGYTECIGLKGTWMSKSKTVCTGIDIYDPIDELLFEPSLPGIAYSFDDDGNWEQAIYQVKSNPIRHECASATIIWQHGTYKEMEDGSLELMPYASDGRQLHSDPCNAKESIYMRYNIPEKISKWVIEWDGYNGKYKLQLYAYDGSKKQPLWLEYSPPKMLPTQVLNPVDKSLKNSLSKINRRLKRSLENMGKTKLQRKDEYDVYMFHFITLSVLGGLTFLLVLVMKNLTPKRVRN